MPLDKDDVRTKCNLCKKNKCYKGHGTVCFDCIEEGKLNA